MNKIIGAFLFIIIITLLFFYNKRGVEDAMKIGIVVPVKHAALDDIVFGFKDELQKLMPEQKFIFDEHNALGDINLQKSAFNKLLNTPVDLVVPVATSTAQMAINLFPKTKALLFLAANISPESAAKLRPDLMGVIDEISIKSQLSFIKAAMPELKKLTLIYSSSDKVFDDVVLFTHAAEEAGLIVQKLMIQNLPELYTIASLIDAQAQALFILKDNLVASGIEALVQQADKRRIPLITSDEGTIKKGGTFALGVVESDIGRQGARIAADFLRNKENAQHIEYLDKISVFINSQACIKYGVDIEALTKAATLFNYEVIKQ
jgi:ABC-type uncharacterized transport system substrate-binding protein